jgi:hypothetical protein
MELYECRHTHLGNANVHSAASVWIKHPSRNDNHVAGRRLDMYEMPRRTTLTVMTSNGPAIECVPAIVDLYFLPDMGRMTMR